MYLDNVFYGFTKKGKRKLLWRKYITDATDIGDVTRTMYYDMEKKVYIDPYNIDVESLVNIRSLVGDIKRKSKRKVIKAYKADCNLLFDTTGAFYGNIVYKTMAGKLLENFFDDPANYNSSEVKEFPQKENILFARFDDPECRVKCVEDGRIYPWTDKIEKGLSVKEIRAINKEVFRKPVVTKKKLLEANYKKKL